MCRNRRCGASAEGKYICTMPSREEENNVKAKFVGSPLVVGKTDATHF